MERSEANLEFHFAISRAAGNKYFQAFYDQVLIDTIRLARVWFSDQLSPDARLRLIVVGTFGGNGQAASAYFSSDCQMADADTADETSVITCRN